MGSPKSSRRRSRERERSRRDDDTRPGDSPSHRDRDKRRSEKRRSRSPLSREHRRDERHTRRDHRDSEPKYDPHKKIKEEPETDSESRRQSRRNREEEDVSKMQYGRPEVKAEDDKDKKEVEKQKPNFGLSGKLSEETNVCNGVVVKYSEPPEARVPKRRWRFYVFKGDESMPTLYIHRQSAYLLGRDRKVADIPIDHPSCSKQHAVLQYRLVNYERPDGSSGRSIRPYIIDLESANGTFVNNQKIEPKRYIELFEKDVIKFGFSSREYVLLHEESKTQAAEDDVGE